MCIKAFISGYISTRKVSRIVSRAIIAKLHAPKTPLYDANIYLFLIIRSKENNFKRNENIIPIIDIEIPIPSNILLTGLLQ